MRRESRRFSLTFIKHLYCIAHRSFLRAESIYDAGKLIDYALGKIAFTYSYENNQRIFVSFTKASIIPPTYIIKSLNDQHESRAKETQRLCPQRAAHIKGHRNPINLPRPYAYHYTTNLTLENPSFPRLPAPRSRPGYQTRRAAQTLLPARD